MRKPLRLFAACSAVLVASTGAAACKSAEPYAAKVNGIIVSKDGLDNEINAIQGNKTYVQAIEQSSQGQLQVSGTGDSTVSQSFVARILTRRIYFEIVHQEFNRRHLHVSSHDEDLARQEVVSSVGDAATFAKFPKSYQNELVHTNAEVLVLQNNMANTSDKNLRAYYASHLDTFENVCAHHILVDTKAQADAIEKQIASAKDKNATFEQLAKSKSKDTGSAANNGDLGCAAPSNYVPEFKNAVRTQRIGVIGQPVKSQFGYHIIRVDSRDPAKPFDEVKDQVKAAITDSQQGPFNEFLSTASKTARVEVNPRYGTYDKTGTAGQVVPPKTPDAASSNG
ncbi:MAG TPA: peptidylprolyl isomerase [Acidimicrobiales bacterium]|nr:peptidylprolyl isomerase [Acidimicrobiales bacterium]